MATAIKSQYVFDTFSLLAFIKDENGSKQVERLLSEVQKGTATGFISVINISELYYITAREKNDKNAKILLRSLKGWKLQFVAVDENIAVLAGKIKTKYPLSLADACCAATAQHMDATIITGDPEFKPVTETNILWLND